MRKAILLLMCLLTATTQAQVYTPVYVTPLSSPEGDSLVGVSVENRFDFISLHGYSLRWQLKRWQQVLYEGTIWLTAKARETETVSIPTVQEASHLCMQVLRRCWRPSSGRVVT